MCVLSVGSICRKGCRIEALHSGAGYFLGTIDKDGMPNCRLSSGYYGDADSAIKSKDFNRQFATENDHCNGGAGCMAQ